VSNPQPARIHLTIANGQGIIQPPVVQVDGGSLVVVNNTDVEATVVLPGGLSGTRSLWHCPPREQVAVPIISKADAKAQGLLGVQIPYGVYFYDGSGTGIRDWGVAGSPPAMQVGP
jgi:hypothetical protein